MNTYSKRIYLHSYFRLGIYHQKASEFFLFSHAPQKEEISAVVGVMTAIQDGETVLTGSWSIHTRAKQLTAYTPLYLSLFAYSDTLCQLNTQLAINLSDRSFQLFSNSRHTQWIGVHELIQGGDITASHPTLSPQDAKNTALRFTSPEWSIRLEFNIEDQRLFLDVRGMFILLKEKISYPPSLTPFPLFVLPCINYFDNNNTR